MNNLHLDKCGFVKGFVVCNVTFARLAKNISFPSSSRAMIEPKDQRHRERSLKKIAGDLAGDCKPELCQCCVLMMSEFGKPWSS